MYDPTPSLADSGSAAAAELNRLATGGYEKSALSHRNEGFE